MKLTDHFFLQEFTNSRTALKRNINNTPSPEITQNLLATAKGMEKVRALLKDKPISITSGYRSPELNKAVKGAAKSHHLLGYAADFTCWSFGSTDDIVKAIAKSDIDYDQVITEGTWVHISFKPTYRKEALVADFDSKGNASYRRFYA